MLPQPVVDFARKETTATDQPAASHDRLPHDNSAPDTPDPFTGERSFIAGSRVTAAQAIQLAKRVRSLQSLVAQSDTGRTSGMDSRQSRDVGKILPLRRVEGRLINTQTGQSLPEIGRGVEAYVYEDSENGVVYKVYEIGKSNDRSIGMRVAIEEGMAGLDTGQLPDIIEKTWAINELGGTPTEIVGRTLTGEIVVKQPRGNDAAQYERAQVLAKAHLQEIPADILPRIDMRSPLYYSHIAGQDVLLGDLHGKNFIGDTIGRGRINDLATHVLTAEELAKLPKLNAWINERRSAAQAQGSADFARAWHGSPHRGIEKEGFKLQKIGTGDGAQGYGWGIYFAEDRKEAESYKDFLGWKSNATLYKGKPLTKSHLEELANGTYNEYLVFGDIGIPDQVIREGKIESYLRKKAQVAQEAVSSFEKTWDNTVPAEQKASEDEWIKWRKDYVNAVNEVLSHIVTPPEGNTPQLYSADIPETHELLDWEKPLRDQPEQVKEKVDSLLSRFEKAGLALDSPEKMTGQQFYKALGRDDRLANLLLSKEGPFKDTWANPERAASELLLAHGIPGLRYLDNHNGSHNFVIWDEARLSNDIQIYYARKKQAAREAQLADLVMTHNLTEANLLHAKKMGGLATPSFAITQGKPPENFGEITLIGSRELAVPKRDTQVFGADVFSTQYPEVQLEIDTNAYADFAAQLAPYNQQVRGIIPDARYIADRGFDGLETSEPLMAQFIEAQGLGLPEGRATRFSLREKIESAGKLGEYHTFVRETLATMTKGERIRQGSTAAGRPRYIPHTLENVVKILKKGLRGGSGFYGVANVRAQLTPQFKSVEVIRKNKGRLATAEEVHAVKKEVESEFLKLVNDISDRGDTWAAAQFLEEAAKSGIARARQTSGDYGLVLDAENQTRISEFFDKLRHMPTQYFEGKLLRAVQVGEFSAAVVPKTIGAEALAYLREQGIKDIRTYDPNDKAAQAKAVGEYQHLFFAREVGVKQHQHQVQADADVLRGKSEQSPLIADDFTRRIERIAPALMMRYHALVGDYDSLFSPEVGVRPWQVDGKEQAAHIINGRKRILWFLQQNLRADKNGLMDERLRRDVLHEAAHAWVNTLERDRKEFLVREWQRDIKAADGWLAQMRKDKVELRKGVATDWAEYWAERLAYENNLWAGKRERWAISGDRGLLAQIYAEFRKFLADAIDLLARAFTRTKRYNIDFRSFLTDTRYNEKAEGRAHNEGSLNERGLRPLLAAKKAEQTREDIQRVIDAAKHKSGHAPQKADLGPVAEWVVEAAQKQGFDIRGYKHTLDGSAVRHILKNHYDAKAEAKRGQVALTDADLLALPQLVQTADKVIFGSKNTLHKDQIVYLKHMPDGSTLYLEEIRSGRGELAAVSARKYPATIGAESILSTLNPNVQDDSGNALTVVERPNSVKADTVRADFARKADGPSMLSPEQRLARNLHELEELNYRIDELKDAQTRQQKAEHRKLLGERNDRRILLDEAHAGWRKTHPELADGQVVDPKATRKRILERQLRKAEEALRNNAIGASEKQVAQLKRTLAREFPEAATDALQNKTVETAASENPLGQQGDTASPHAPAPAQERGTIHTPALIEGHSNLPEPAGKSWWESTRDFLKGFRGAIPELAGTGQQFESIRQFNREINRASPRVWHEAGQTVGAIVRPLQEIKVAKLDSDKYRVLQKTQQRLRKLEVKSLKGEEQVKKHAPEIQRLQAQVMRLDAELESHPYILYGKLVRYLNFDWRVKNIKGEDGSPIAMPGGLTAEQIAGELARIEQLVNAHTHKAAIFSALDKHMKLVKRTWDDLVARDLAVSAEKQNPYYFPHLVMSDKGTAKLARVRMDTAQDFRPYLIAPEGSTRPIEMDYVKAMHAHLVMVDSHNTRADLVRDLIKDEHDLVPKLRERAKELSEERGERVTWGDVFNEEYAGKGWVIYTPDNKLHLHSEATVDRNVVAKRLGITLGDGPLQEELRKAGITNVELLASDIREALVPDGKEKWVLPEKVADALTGMIEREMRWDKKPNVFVNSQNLWKKNILFAPWNYIRYEFNNTISDIEKVFSADPATVGEMPSALREIFVLFANDPNNPPTRDAAIAFKLGVMQSVTVSELGKLPQLQQFAAMKTTQDKWRDIAKAASTAFLAGGRSTVELSQLREATFRYAKFKADMKRLRGGARPVYAGAYWKDVEALKVTQVHRDLIGRAEAETASNEPRPVRQLTESEVELLEHRDFLENTPPVSDLDGSQFPVSDTPLPERVAEWYENNGYSTITVPHIGTVTLDKTAVSRSMNHGMGRNKAIAFAAVPDVLLAGRIIHTEAMEGSRTGTAYHVAAPVRIAGKDFVATVLLKADQNINRMYVHEVFLKEKLHAPKVGADAAVATTGERADKGNGVLATVLREIYSVNTQSLSDTHAQTDPLHYVQAAQISLATFGDYGDISVSGQKLRRALIPFYSWIEINFRYHANLFRNLKDMVKAGEMAKADARKAGTRAAGVVAATFTRKVAALIIAREVLLFAAAEIWNNTGWRADEEDKLSDEDRRRTHIVLPPHPDGRARVIYLPTAFGDLAKWFGGNEMARLTADLVKGNTTLSKAVGEYSSRFLPELVNNVTGGIGPLIKGPYTYVSQKSVFPNFLKQRTIPAYDLKWNVLSQMTDGFTADMIRRVLDKDYLPPRSLGDWAQQLILQDRKRDAASWAFYDIKRKAADWNERRTGSSRGMSEYNSPEAQVLRNYRRAIYNGDLKNAIRFYDRLLEFGYTAERLRDSIRSQDPLHEIPKEHRREFVASLSPFERRQLERAYIHYAKMNSLRGYEAQLFPRANQPLAWRARHKPRYGILEKQITGHRQLTGEELAKRAHKAMMESLR